MVSKDKQTNKYNEGLSTGSGSGRVLQAGRRVEINIQVRACGLSPLH